MGLEFYKGNKALKGSAVFLTIDGKNKAIYIAFKKQSGWNETSHRPTFKGGLTANIKLEMAEMAGILDAIDNRKRLEFFHDSEKKKTQIFFGPYTKTRDENGNPIGEPIGFSLTVVQTDKKDTSNRDVFAVAFSFIEARLLVEWIKYALTHAFNYIYSEDVKRGKEFQSKKLGKEQPVENEDTLLDGESPEAESPADDEPLF